MAYLELYHPRFLTKQDGFVYDCFLVARDKYGKHFKDFRFVSPKKFKTQQECHTFSFKRYMVLEDDCHLRFKWEK